MGDDAGAWKEALGEDKQWWRLRRASCDVKVTLPRKKVAAGLGEV